MIRLLLDRSMALLPGDGVRVNFTMTMWALGSMYFHPGQEYMTALLAVLNTKGIMEKFDAQVNTSCLFVYGSPPLDPLDDWIRLQSFETSNYLCNSAPVCPMHLMSLLASHSGHSGIHWICAWELVMRCLKTSEARSYNERRMYLSSCHISNRVLLNDLQDRMIIWERPC